MEPMNFLNLGIEIKQTKTLLNRDNCHLGVFGSQRIERDAGWKFIKLNGSLRGKNTAAVKKKQNTKSSIHRSFCFVLPTSKKNTKNSL